MCNLAILFTERRDKQQRTPFHRAAYHERMRALFVMLQVRGTTYGLTLTDPEGLTPFYYAHREGRYLAGDSMAGILALYPEAGRDRNAAGETLMHLAVRAGKYALLSGLLTHFPQGVYEPYGEDGETPIFLALKYNRMDMVELMVKVLPQDFLFHTNEAGEPFLYTVVRKGMLPTLMVVKKTASKDVLARTNSAGETLIHYAVRGGHLPVVQLLTEWHPEGVREKNRNDGATPMHAAARYGKLDMIRVMMTKAREVALSALNERDGVGDTPMHRAAANGHADVAKAVLEAQPVGWESARNAAGESPRDVAMRCGHPATAALLP